jgi:hypothetical protein
MCDSSRVVGCGERGLWKGKKSKLNKKEKDKDCGLLGLVLGGWWGLGKGQSRVSVQGLIGYLAWFSELCPLA